MIGRRCEKEGCFADVPHDMDDAGYCEKGHWNEPRWVSGAKCECGSDKVREFYSHGSRLHSTWCPAYKPPRRPEV